MNNQPAFKALLENVFGSLPELPDYTHRFTRFHKQAADIEGVGAYSAGWCGGIFAANQQVLHRLPIRREPIRSAGLILLLVHEIEALPWGPG